MSCRESDDGAAVVDAHRCGVATAERTEIGNRIGCRRGGRPYALDEEIERDARGDPKRCMSHKSLVAAHQRFRTFTVLEKAELPTVLNARTRYDTNFDVPGLVST